MIKIELDHGEGEFEIKGTEVEIFTDTVVVLRGIRDVLREDKGESTAFLFEQFVINGEAARCAFRPHQQEGGTTNAN